MTRFVSLLTLAMTGGCAVPKPGILVMAFGGDAERNRDIEAVVAPLRDKYPTEIAFAMVRPAPIQQAVQRLESQGVRRIAVVRLLISGESLLTPTECILGLRDELAQSPRGLHGSGDSIDHGAQGEQVSSQASFALSRKGVAESSLVDDILVDRVGALSTNPSEESVLILAHGPADDAENERWLANMRLRAQRIHELGPFRHVECETLREDWPDRRAAAEKRIRRYVKAGSENGGRVIVVPFRIAGCGPYGEVLAGLSFVADGRGLCPHPNMTRWIEQTAEECFATR